MNLLTLITAPLRGGHKFLAHEFIIAYLKDCNRNSAVRPRLDLLQRQVDQCRPSEDDLRDLLFVKRGPPQSPGASNRKMAMYHILWFLLPFVRQGKTKEIADLMTRMEKCMPTKDELRGVINWWKKRHG